MNTDQLKQILDLMREHDLSEVEIEQDGVKLKVRKGASGAFVAHSLPPTASPAAGALPAPLASHTPATTPPVLAGEVELELAVMKSPIVGTFYRAPEPGAPPFVEVGSTVKKGQVLCIIEAMKLMNEIDSEYDGEIVSIYVENGHAVQYGERLFAIRTK